MELCSTYLGVSNIGEAVDGGGLQDLPQHIHPLVNLKPKPKLNWATTSIILFLQV